MKIIQLFSLFIAVGFLFISCNGKKNDTSSAKGEETSASGSNGSGSLPFLSSQDVNALYSQADNVDIIFYKLPISVNQDDPASAKNTVLYVSPTAPNITATCEPLGRLSWISNGKIIREADFYVGEGCNHFVFMENGQPAYKNAMAVEGIQFFQTIMSQVQSKSNQ